MDVAVEYEGKRIVWVDYAKSFSIFFVILIHTHCDVFLCNAMNTLALPTFFFISGFLFNPDRHKRFMPFFKKRFRQIIIPYIWMNILAYIFWFYVGRRVGDNIDNVTSWYVPLKGMLLGVGPDLVHDIALWSFISFFFVEMIFYWLHRLYSKTVLWLVITFVSAIVSGYLMDYIWNLPFVAGTLPGGLFFYSLGRCYKRYGCRWLLSHGLFYDVIFLAMFLTAVYYNGECKFYICKFGNPFVYFFGAVLGIILVISVSSHFSLMFGENWLVGTISVGTLIICGLHLMVFSFIKGIGYFIFDIAPGYMTSGSINGMLFSVVCLALCVPIVVFIRKYLRILVDK